MKLNREATYMPLEDIVRLPRNAKDHDVGAIHEAVDEFGFLERIIVNRETGHLIAGHGRADTMQQKKAAGQSLPDGAKAKNGSWLLPVDVISIPPEKEDAAALALNRMTERGGWNSEQLASLLADLAAQDALKGTGFDGDDLDRLLWELGKKTEADVEEKYREYAGDKEKAIEDAEPSDKKMIALTMTTAEYEEFEQILKNWVPSSEDQSKVAILLEIMRYGSSQRDTNTIESLPK